MITSEAECHELFEALKALSRHPKRAFRVNPLREGALDKIASAWPTIDRVPWAPNAFYIDEKNISSLAGSPVSGAGLVYIQEPGAMEPVTLLDPRPGEVGLDLCAAPGGKSTQIAERLMGQGWLLSNEFVRSRAARLDALLARHGAPNVTVTSLDSSEIARLYPQAFDFVLVDAPCSGESLFAKRIDDRSDISDAEVQGCARRQFAILENAYLTLKPGGRLVYSTCTYSIDENEEVISKFLSARADLKLKKEIRRWPHRDGVAGGYAALLVSTREPETATSAEFAANPHGLLRHGVTAWNGEIDLYAAAMSSSFVAPALSGIWKVEDLDARKYLRGESLAHPASASEKFVLRIFWENWPLGPGRAVEGRVNNLLPKILRIEPRPVKKIALD